MQTLTGYNLKTSVLERIAIERGVIDIDNFGELTSKDRDLLLADILLAVYLLPSQSASISQSHNNFSQSIGSQVITDKRNIYDMMIGLYRKYNDEKLDSIEELEGGAQWLSI
jgi:hypothetical protein